MLLYIFLIIQSISCFCLALDQYLLALEDIPAFLLYYPWDLLMVIAKASLTGNWSLLSGTGNVSVLGDNLILGINIILPLNLLSL